MRNERSDVAQLVMLETQAEMTLFSKSQRTMNAPELYEIRVAGYLSESWRARFEGLTMHPEPEGETVLSGKLDQAALHGILMKIRDMGLKLISVRRIGPAGAS